MKTINYMTGGVSIRAELVEPARSGNGSAVVIAHGSDGITDELNGPWASMMREFAGEFAKQGSAVLIPYYFERTGTQPGEQAMLSMLVHLPAWQEAVSDGLTAAAALPGVTARRVGLVGFSLGGRLSLGLRAKAPVVVEFFAPLLNGIGPSAAKPWVQIHHGEADGLVDVENARQIAKLLTAEGVAPELHTYPKAGHGFGGKSPGDAEARKKSLESTARFLAAHL